MHDQSEVGLFVSLADACIEGLQRSAMQATKDKNQVGLCSVHHLGLDGSELACLPISTVGAMAVQKERPGVQIGSKLIMFCVMILHVRDGQAWVGVMPLLQANPLRA